MCLKPVTLTKKTCGRWYHEFTVPCGKCEECVKDVQNEYIIRTVEEQKKRGSIVFITLTYNENSVPIFTDDGEIDEDTGEVLPPVKYRSLNRKDIVNWKKRVCQRYYRLWGERLDFSFLICGEYGPKTHRPHYHGLLLGLTKGQAQLFINDWQKNYGYVCAKFVPSIMSDVVKVARYCSKYICKLKEFDTMPSPNAERPRKLTSVGYGLPDEKRFKHLKDYYLAKDFLTYDENKVQIKKSDINRLVNEIIKRRRYNLNGNSYKLPTYYRKRFFYVKDEDSGNYRASQIQRMITSVVQYNYVEDFESELRELMSVYGLRDWSEAVSRYNMIHDADKEARRKAIREANLKYLKRAKVA